MKGKALHHHCCTLCRRRYSDTCSHPAENSRCSSCRSGIASSYAPTLEPRECCEIACRSATAEELKIYRLAGTGPWYICQRCWRQHGYLPALRQGLEHKDIHDH